MIPPKVLPALLFFCVLALAESSSFDDSQYLTLQGIFNQEFTSRVNHTFTHVLMYSLERNLINGSLNLRVETRVQQRVSIQEEMACPVQFFLKETQTSRSWSLPLITKNASTGERSYTNAGGFTVCLEGNLPEGDDPINFLIFVSTCSEADVEYYLEFKSEYSGFMLELANSVDVKVAPTLFSYFRFNFPPDVDRVVVEVLSNDTSCATVSIQSPWCKVLNENILVAKDNNGTSVKIEGLWQDMITRAAIPVTKSKFKDGFFLGFVVHESDERCETYKGISAAASWAPIQISTVTGTGSQIFRTKALTIKIIEEIPTKDIVWPILFSLLYTLGVFGITLVVYAVFQCSPRLNVYSNQFKSQRYSRVFRPLVDIHKDGILTLDIHDSGIDVHQPSSGVFLTALERQGITNGWLRMNALIQPKKAGKKKTMKKIQWAKHMILTLVIGIFYSLPTFQLAYTYEKIIDSTGRTDICYRNYLCAHTIGSWNDFNHLYSNISYAIFGVLFLFFVWHRHSLDQKLEEAHPVAEGDIGYGVIRRGDIFYSLGVALIMEGVLSGLYHNCPTQLNFQYDTSFMFILAVLSTVTIFQFRHKDPISPYNTFCLIALIAFISVGGLMLNSQVYKGIIMIVHLLLAAILYVYLYYVGYVRDEDGKVITNLQILRKCEAYHSLKNHGIATFKWRSFRHKTRLVYLIPFIFFNIIICVWQISGKSSFPMYLVYAFAGNTLVYFVYYLGMKLYHRELFNRPSIQPIIYLTMAVILGPLGVYFFCDAKYDTDLTPAASKTLNDHCIIAGFYDSHDVWHFLSAGALFSFFMGLLTLDDGILRQSRRDIVVF